MKAHHFGELETIQQLNVEDLLHGAVELQHSADAPRRAGGEIHNRYAALQLVAARRQGDAVHRGRGADLREANECVVATQCQATREAGSIAGLEVVRILNEPTAAALEYGVPVRSFQDLDLAEGWLKE